MRDVRLFPLLVLLSAACSGEGNTGRKPVPQSLLESVPWTNGGVPVFEAVVLFDERLPAAPAPMAWNSPDEQPPRHNPQRRPAPRVAR